MFKDKNFHFFTLKLNTNFLNSGDEEAGSWPGACSSLQQSVALRRVCHPCTAVPAWNTCIFQFLAAKRMISPLQIWVKSGILSTSRGTWLLRVYQHRTGMVLKTRFSTKQKAPLQSSETISITKIRTKINIFKRAIQEETNDLYDIWSEYWLEQPYTYLDDPIVFRLNTWLISTWTT